jgi:hypothetical protein
MTDFRALCAELIEIIEEHCNPDEYSLLDVVNVLNRARAALEAQPEPQGPTDAELITMWATTRYIDQPEGGLAYGRAVLARWGRPAIEPVPVSERLPGPEDCDEEGLCWWWDSDCRQTEAWCRGLSEYASGSYSHWLPHWALPVPGVEGADA